jgi:hypothetical protein
LAPTERVNAAGIIVVDVTGTVRKVVAVTKDARGAVLDQSVAEKCMDILKRVRVTVNIAPQTMACTMSQLQHASMMGHAPTQK